MEPSRKVSIVSLIFADYTALLCFLFPVVTWGMFTAAILGLSRSEPGEDGTRLRFLLWSAIASTAICVPLLYRRIHSIQSLLRDGIAIPARLIRVWFMKDRGRIDYEYTYEGHTYRAGMALTKSKRAAALKEGQEITVLVHPSMPSRSAVADVFG